MLLIEFPGKYDTIIVIRNWWVEPKWKWKKTNDSTIGIFDLCRKAIDSVQNLDHCYREFCQFSCQIQIKLSFLWQCIRYVETLLVAKEDKEKGMLFYKSTTLHQIW